MTWLRVDDQLAFAAATITAGNAAMGAWLRMSTWSAAQLADGAVPRAVACTMAAPGEVQALITAGLLIDHGDTYEIVGYLDTNPTREQVLAQREARMAGGRKGAARRWDGPSQDGPTHDSTHGSTHDSTHGSTQRGTHRHVNAPVPSRPVPASPVPIPTQPEKTQTQTATSPLTLSADPPKPKTKKATKAKPEIPGHKDVIACFAVEFEKARQEKPIIDKMQGLGAKELLEATKSAELACEVIRRAFTGPDDFVRTRKPSLRFIASNVNAYLGTTPAKTNGRPVVTPQRGRAFDIPTDDGTTLRGHRGQILQPAGDWQPDDMSGETTG